MQTISFVFWNVENLFNPETGGPRGDMIPELGWTWDVFDRKLVRFSKVIDAMDIPGGIDLMGLCEVDDHIVITKFIEKCFNTAEYDYVAAEDLHTNNLDTALVYRKDRFEVLGCETIHILNRYPKGDAFIVDLKEKKTGKKFVVVINHWTSRCNGREFTRSFRCTTAENLQAYLLKRSLEEPDIQLIVAGDFNDHPYSKSILEHLGASYDRQTVIEQTIDKDVILYNSCWSAMMGDNPGTHYYKRERETSWSMLDQIILSRELLLDNGWTYRIGSFEIRRKEMSDDLGHPVPSLYWTEDRERAIQDGVSDHFPVSIFLDYNDD
ncbi:hypothetical protein KAJ27_21390 [bacterium]|nr:hypothetical protein [bacterium]